MIANGEKKKNLHYSEGQGDVLHCHHTVLLTSCSEIKYCLKTLSFGSREYTPKTESVEPEYNIEFKRCPCVCNTLLIGKEHIISIKSIKDNAFSPTSSI